MAADWTDATNSRQIFTGRLRLIETAVPSPTADDPDHEDLKTDLLLEDASTGALFAAAPYTSAAVVEPVLDSSRFFAVTVRDPASGRKAVLGLGFEEREVSFDFVVALQEARRALGWDNQQQQGPAAQKRPGASVLTAGKGTRGPAKKEDDKVDYSLKEGETITINLGGAGKFGKRSQSTVSESPSSLAGFSLPPPPPPASSSARSGGGGSAGSGSAPSFSLPPPPPPAGGVSGHQQHGRRSVEDEKSRAAAMGFDDGEFGEFA